ncbi:MFS transporter [Vibrio intestinalis]|uniref:MFS transporter n=1 Tax=Vibrio intestinalis TaxID=2933291 RepID=UPI0021A8DE9B|nr:MFS transporter [Vibrio intestinalis]
MTKTKLTIQYAIQQTIHWFITGLIIPVLILIFQTRSLSLTDIGLIMTIWVGSTALLEVPLGVLADKIGRLTTYLVSLAVMILGSVALLIADSFISVAFAALLLGSARAIYSGTLDAWFYDAFSLAKGKMTFHRALAKVNFMVTIGLALGALAGGYLGRWAPFIPFELQASMDANLVVIIGLCLLLMMFTPCLIKERHSRHHTTSTPIKTNHQDTLPQHIKTSAIKVLRESLSHPVIGRLFKAGIIYGWVLSGLENLWQPYLKQLINDGSSLNVFGIIAALYFVMAGAASLASSPLLALLDQSHRALLVVSRLMASLLLVLLAFSQSIISFSCLYLSFFFFFTIGCNSEKLLVNQHTPSRHRSTILSLHSLVITSGALVASTLLGLIAEYYSISLAWQITALLLALSCGWFYWLPKSSIKPLGELPKQESEHKVA